MARSRSILTSLAHLFADSSQPIYLLDQQRRVAYLNAACEHWVGVKTEELAGQRCDYHSGDQPAMAQEQAAALCPPPPVFLGQRQHANIVLRRTGGELSQRRVQFEPLLGDSDAVIGVLAIAAAHDEPLAANSLADNPDSPEQLHTQLQKLRASWGRRFHLDRLVGTSLAAARLREQVRSAVDSHSRTVIIGPPGSGREQVARTIFHGRVAASELPLLPLDCRLMDAELTRVTLDSFMQSRPQSTSEAAATLLLLDVDCLPAEAQHELARYCDASRRPVATLATARTSLMTLAEEGRFRPDLAYTLSTFVIELPPLAARREDIALLAQSILEEANQAGGKQLGGFAPDALRMLANYSWPRNIEELAEVIRAAHAKAESVLVGTADLPPHLHAAADVAAHPRRPDPPIEIDAFLAEVEKELLGRALRQAKGNKAKAAKLLGMNRVRLLRRIGQLGLE